MECSLVKFNGRTFRTVKCEATQTDQFCGIVCAEYIYLCNAKENILSFGKHKWHKRALDNEQNFHRANVFESKHENVRSKNDAPK